MARIRQTARKTVRPPPNRRLAPRTPSPVPPSPPYSPPSSETGSNSYVSNSETETESWLRRALGNQVEEESSVELERHLVAQHEEEDLEEDPEEEELVENSDQVVPENPVENLQENPIEHNDDLPYEILVDELEEVPTTEHSSQTPSASTFSIGSGTDAPIVFVSSTDSSCSSVNKP